MKKIADVAEGLYLGRTPADKKDGVYFQHEDRLFRLSDTIDDPEDLLALLNDITAEVCDLNEDCIDDHFGEIMQGIFDHFMRGI